MSLGGLGGKDRERPDHRNGPPRSILSRNGLEADDEGFSEYGGVRGSTLC